MNRGVGEVFCIRIRAETGIFKNGHRLSDFTKESKIAILKVLQIFWQTIRPWDRVSYTHIALIAPVV